jgi:hypothetical protein
VLFLLLLIASSITGASGTLMNETETKDTKDGSEQGIAAAWEHMAACKMDNKSLAECPPVITCPADLSTIECDHYTQEYTRIFEKQKELDTSEGSQESIQLPPESALKQSSDLLRITADFIPDDNEYTENEYDLIRFSLSYTNGSRLCPSNSCIFQIQGGHIRENMFSPNLYSFTGVLRVGSQDTAGGMRYQVFDLFMDLKVIETVERSNMIIHTVTGTVNLGETLSYDLYNGTIRLGGSYVALDVSAQNPWLFGP